MTLAIEPAEPVTVEVALGCGTSRTVVVHWEEGTLYARTGSEPQLAFQPSLEAWKRFWRAADKANVWNWDRMLQADQPVLWRTHWILVRSGHCLWPVKRRRQFKTFVPPLRNCSGPQPPFSRDNLHNSTYSEDPCQSQIVIKKEDIARTAGHRFGQRRPETLLGVRQLFLSGAPEAGKAHDSARGGLYVPRRVASTPNSSSDTVARPFRPLGRSAVLRPPLPKIFGPSCMSSNSSSSPFQDAERGSRLADILGYVRVKPACQSGRRQLPESARISRTAFSGQTATPPPRGSFDIASSWARRPKAYRKTIDYLQKQLSEFGADEPTPWWAKLINLLLDAGEGNASRFASICGTSAQRCETAGQWETARLYWQVKARCETAAGQDTNREIA